MFSFSSHSFFREIAIVKKISSRNVLSVGRVPGSFPDLLNRLAAKLNFNASTRDTELIST